MRYELIGVTKTSLPPLNSYIEKLHDIWTSNQITNNGLLVQKLRHELKSFLDVKNLIPVANGTIALQLAIRGMGLKGEIITTPYSYVATTNAILWEGCEPIFVDIDKDTFCIDPELIESAITERTSAILATHVYGYPCDVSKIENIAKKYGIKVIYDAAHAFGVRLNGKSILEYGNCSTLSFHATKIFHTAEGGAVISKNEKDDQKIFLLSKFGHIGEENYLDIGINAKMSELHAALGLVNLPMIPQIILERSKRAAWYDEYFINSKLQRPLEPKGFDYNYAYYPIVFSTHEQMMAAKIALNSKDIHPRRYFFPSLNTLPFLRTELLRPCPISESLASRVLCLPIYGGLNHSDVKKIAATILSCLTV